MDSSPLRARAATRVVAAAAVILVLAMAAHLAIDARRHAAPWTNNDTALIVYLAQQMDAGARLYVDWRDPDPPSVFFVALTGVRGGRIAGIPALLAYDFIVLAAALTGLFVLVHALRHMGRPWPAVVLASAGYLFFLSKPGSVVRDFGQREHLFALLLIPEVFAIADGDHIRWRPVWCAALAFMAMMKPQFAAAIVLLELIAARWSRPRASDLAGFGIGAAAPFAMLWLHSPDSFRGLFTESLGLQMSGAYAVLNRSPAVLLTRGPLLVTLAAIVSLMFLVLVARRDNAVRRMAVTGSAALVWAAASVVSQQKYFPYHFAPLFGLALVCGGWAAGEWLSAHHRSILAAISAAAVVVLGTAMFHRDVAANGDPLAVRLGREVGPDARLLVVSVYSHGLCTTYREAPRCVGPDSQVTRLAQMARAADAHDRLKSWASGVAQQVRQQRPDVIAVSTSDSAMPNGLSPAQLLLEQFPSVPADEYVPLSPSANAYVQPRGWIVFRRSDRPERTPRR